MGTALIRYLSDGSPVGPVRLRALVRSLDRSRSLCPLQTEIIEVDYCQPDSVRAAVEGADAVVHLAGALLPRRGETLLEANVEATRIIVTTAASAGVKSFVYLSFPSANPASKNDYLRSKGMAEEFIKRAEFSGVIFRVPMIVGPESASVERLRQMAAAPVVPLVSGGSVRIQPISQVDVVAAIAWAISVAPKPIRVLNLVGPETMTYAELLRRIAERLGKRPRVFPIPKAAAWLSACLAGSLVPSLGWNLTLFEVLFNEHLADMSEARAALPFVPASVDEALDQAVSALG